MSYYDSVAAYTARGIDYDLATCFDHNNVGMEFSEIEQVLAVWEGERDGVDWRWVIKCFDGRYAFIQGGCDSSGWDCLSWGKSVYTDTPQDAAKYALAGWGYGKDVGETIYLDLLRQFIDGKRITWREQMDDEMGAPV